MVWGNLGAGPNPPQRASNAPASCCSAALSSATPGRSSPALRLAVRSSASTSCRGGVVDLVAPVPPGVVDGGQQLQEGGLGEVGAAVERAPVGGEEHRHRPAAAAGQGLDGVHVDGVDVRPLLAVDLDVDEQVVHHRRHLGVLEALVGHHVAPVAGRVAHREQDRRSSSAARVERLGAPRVPVDRVVAVLAQVRRGLVGEPVHAGDATGPRPSGSPVGSRPHGAPTGREGGAGDRRLARGSGGPSRPSTRRPAPASCCPPGSRTRWRRRRPTMDGEVAVYAANAGDLDAADACVAATIERFGGLDILVNNAATNPYYGPTLGVDHRPLRQDLRGEPPRPAVLVPVGVGAGVQGAAGGHRQHRLGRRACGRRASSASTT